MNNEQLKRIEEFATLRKKREVLIEAIAELNFDANRVEIYELHYEISEIDRRLHAIDPSLV